MTKQKRFVLFLLFFFLAVVGLFFGGGAFYQAQKAKAVDTGALLFSALEEMESRSSYRYNLKATLRLRNLKTAETNLHGEKDADGNFHVVGELMDTRLEVFQFDSDHYRYSFSAKKWIALTDSPLPSNPVLQMLLEPTVNFTFRDTISSECTDIKKENGHYVYQYTVIPKEGFHIADRYFTDLRYKLSVNGENGRIEDAVIRGVSRTESECELTLYISFYDINKEFTLKPPKTDN